MSLQEKVCPQCATTYRLEAVQCADCEVELVDAATFEGLAGAEAAAIDFENLVCVRASDSNWAEGFHSALGEAGVGAHIAGVDDGSGHLKVGVFVHPDDHDRAMQIDHDFSRQHLGLDPDQLRAGHCGICGTSLDDADQELCDSCRRDLEPEPATQEVVLGSDGIPRAQSVDGKQSSATTNLMLLAIGVLLGVAAIYWMR